MRTEGQGRLIAKVAASRTIFVAGAGIGGLAASLSLAAKGFRVVVLEKSAGLEEAGAGLQLSPNASRILVQRPSSSLPRRPAAILRADRLARNARCHPIAARIYVAPGPALDGAGRASCHLPDRGRATDQRGRGAAGNLE